MGELKGENKILSEKTALPLVNIQVINFGKLNL